MKRTGSPRQRVPLKLLLATGVVVLLVVGATLFARVLKIATSAVTPLLVAGLTKGLPTYEGLDYEFVINVFAWRRAGALKILCESLAKANFGGYTVPLHFYVDGEASDDVLQYVEGFSWKYGEKLVIVRPSRLGLEENIATSCVTDGFPASDNRLCFFFEDDGEVSSHFFQWTLKQLAAGHNPQNPQLVGIALNGLRVDQYSTRRYFEDNKPAPEQLTFPPMRSSKFDKSGWSWYGAFLAHRSLGGSVFLLQQPSSWGSVYFSRHWERFQQFRRAQREQEAQGLRIDLMHSRSVEWDNSWKRHMLDYMYLHGCYMLYPNYRWQLSLATTRRELGEHTLSKSDQFTLWVFVTPLDMYGVSLTDGNPPAPSVFDFRLRKTTEEELLVIGCAAHRMIASTSAVCEATTPHAIANIVAKRLAPAIPDLTVFTTLKLPDKLPRGKLLTPERLAFTAIEEMWPRVELLVFASPSDCSKIRNAHYVRCVSDEPCRHPTERRPTVGCLFQAARDYPASGSLIAYSNSDIVHSKTLLPAVDAAKRAFPSCMVVGCRTNVAYNQEIEGLDMSTAARHGPQAIDYFVMPKSSRLVGEIPAFLIGSTRFDNWIVMKGLQDPEMAVVDITEAHTVLHPVAAKGVIKASADRDGAVHNALLAGPDFRLGNIAYAKLTMDTHFRLHANPAFEHAMHSYATSAPEWALRYEAEKVTNFQRYLTAAEALYYVVALMHPTMRKISGFTIEHRKAQNLVAALRPDMIANRTVLLTPTAMLGKRMWTFQELLERVLDKQSKVARHISCRGSGRTTVKPCWIQQSEDASLLIVDNSDKLVLQHPAIYDALQADPSLLLLTHLSFEQLLTDRRSSRAFERQTTSLETDPLTMLTHRNLACVYALPPKHVELSEPWDSASHHVLQQASTHRSSITADTLRAAVRKWRRRHRGGDVTLLCFPFQSVIREALSISAAR